METYGLGDRHSAVIMNPALLVRLLARDSSNRYLQTGTPLNQHLRAAINWLATAQDITPDGGVSLRYSLLFGWAPSYPETTGYIIPTIANFYRRTQSNDHKVRALKMADWELSIQNEDGSFMGGPLTKQADKLVFDTGQVIFGLTTAHQLSRDGKYLQAAVRAANWLVRVQDDAGTWTRYTHHGITHTYHARVAWALAELSTLASNAAYETSARKNIEWVLTQQQPNLWFNNAAFTNAGHSNPSTHTLGYTIRGILETGCCLKEQKYIDAAIKTSDLLLQIMRPDGSFSATYGPNWDPQSKFTCLTGNAQIAIVFLRLFGITHDTKYLRAGQRINRYLSRKQVLYVQDPRANGALAGSYPIWGHYQRFAFPNWAIKFFADALMLEEDTTQ